MPSFWTFCSVLLESDQVKRQRRSRFFIISAAASTVAGFPARDAAVPSAPLYQVIYGLSAEQIPLASSSPDNISTTLKDSGHGVVKTGLWFWLARVRFTIRPRTGVWTPRQTEHPDILWLLPEWCKHAHGEAIDGISNWTRQRLKVKPLKSRLSLRFASAFFTAGSVCR